MDDAARFFYERFAQIGEGKMYYYSLEDFLTSVEDATGQDFTDFYKQYVYGNNALPLASYFEDPDQDGLMTGHENEIGTNSNNLDSDGDGLSDGQEVDLMGTDPLIPASPTTLPSATPTPTSIVAPTETTSPSTKALSEYQNVLIVIIVVMGTGLLLRLFSKLKKK